ncbi:D-alanyl-D-alanine carboxypeptidase [Scopulibacillus darangshiensis]|uniref:serine-type D-Ala-D-Ala carboxypeptidase n=1 Tax=Scopulibacillus darangshiensis TaxID=442528 RepID=A0A4R2PBK5_9BACL|nr:D-alanyl-D-alanine carboxypeptidase family protein [Scopulibacillus darangshiensis]TCP31694.1 D-alanyl-D-alanine carboxypeptidase [Scopulibacillus darangshiensis]
MTAYCKRVITLLIGFSLLIPLMPVNQASATTVSVSAQSAILMDQSSGRVLYEKNSHKKVKIASITKVMTAILAVESGEMDDTVKVSANAVRTEGSSIYLKKGEKIKLRDLVYGLMLRSGNDAAVSIAEAVGGSVQGFVYMMNKKARELGMLDTHFANPHGLDAKGDPYSSAYDMALVTKYAMKNPAFRKIFKTKVHKAPNPTEKWDRVWRNKNKLLFRYDYSTGGKTGFTKRAGRTLISTASKDDMDLIVVTLNDGDDWQDHMNLFNWGFKKYDMVTIAKKGKLSGIKVKKYFKNHLYVHHDLKLPLSDNEKEDLSTKLTLYEPPKKKEWKHPPAPIGMLSVRSDNETIYKLPIFYSKAKEKEKGFWSFVGHIFMSSIRIDADD